MAIREPQRGRRQVRTRKGLGTLVETVRDYGKRAIGLFGSAIIVTAVAAPRLRV